MTMRSKVTILSAFLLIIFIACMLCACGGTTTEAPPDSNTPLDSNDSEIPPDSDVPTTPDGSDMSPTSADKVEVVYFYRPQRCHSCIYAEDTTLYTLETYFSEELASGKITFTSFDLSAEENAAIVGKYEAYTSSLFINTVVDGTDNIEMVNEIWLVIGDDDAFIELVKSKIEQSLSGEG